MTTGWIWTGARGGVVVSAEPDAPARLLLPAVECLAAGGHPLVDLFTAAERRARTSQGYVRSAVGERLRPVRVTPFVDAVEVVQHDARTGIEVATRVELTGAQAAVVRHTVRNTAATPVVLTAVTSFGLLVDAAAVAEATITWARSTWLAENRWRTDRVRDHLPETNLPLHAQSGRGRWAVSSHGSWSTGEHLPTGVLTAGTHAVAWELETSSPWLWEIGELLDGVYVTGLGPAEAEHGFAHELPPEGTFEAVPAVIGWSADGHDGAIGALTGARRLRRQVGTGGSPVVYNDFMNTLMGDPSTEKLTPLIAAAAAAGAEVFCVDAGWFAADGDWWHTVGEWREAPGRFTGGLAAVLDDVRGHGMVAGLWLEPEVVGTAGPVADALPAAAYFQRDGVTVVEHDRYHLDFRHAAVRARLDAVVDRLVAEYGIGFLKLDYNINPGGGTDVDATTPAAGLLAHGRAYRDWLLRLHDRHPGLLVENCASGAMRADAALLRVTGLQSTSDQQDYRRYPPIAVAAPMTVPPEQAGNWAYPDPTMTPAQVTFAMLAGIVGRLYLSGFLHRLDGARRALVAEAVTVHKGWRAALAEAVPAWPLGLPDWDDTALALRLDTPDGALLAVWSRAHGDEIELPGITALTQLYPVAAPAWSHRSTGRGTRIRLPDDIDARLYRIARPAQEE